MTELQRTIDMMESIIASANFELLKFQSGNMSAGTRVRKHMQDIKNLAQNVRLEVQSIKNSK
jgi:hypothetical protein